MVLACNVWPCAMHVGFTAAAGQTWWLGAAAADAEQAGGPAEGAGCTRRYLATLTRKDVVVGCKASV